MERGFEARRRFAADALHELSTPLAVLHARVYNALADPDAWLAELAHDVRVEVDQAERLVEALLALVRAHDATLSTRPQAGIGLEATVELPRAEFQTTLSGRALGQ